MTEPVAPTSAAAVKPRWSVRKAAAWAYAYALAHPHAIVAYAVAIYTALHRAGV